MPKKIGRKMNRRWLRKAIREIKPNAYDNQQRKEHNAHTWWLRSWGKNPIKVSTPEKGYRRSNSPIPIKAQKPNNRGFSYLRSNRRCVNA